MKSFRMYPTINADELIKEVSRRMYVDMTTDEIIERLVGDNYSNDSFKEFDIIEVIADGHRHYEITGDNKHWVSITNCIADILDALAPGEHLWLLDVSW